MVQTGQTESRPAAPRLDEARGDTARPDKPQLVLGPNAPGMLAGIRVIEFADETAESCGLVLAGLGAEVIKIEPPEGNSTRRIGPFLNDDENPEESIFFWSFNRGKKSVAVDPAKPAGRDTVLGLLATADILIDSSCGRLNTMLGLDRAAMLETFPRLVVARMTPFGDDGPWARYKASDLVHLALGGVMMNCGYDKNPLGEYDLPPIAPQLWHAYQIASDQLAMGIMAALIARDASGRGQDVACAVHEAVSKNTELDLMSWVMRRAPLFRQTCRHSTERPSHVPNIGHTKDGRWIVTYGVSARDQANLVPFLERYGMAADLEKPGANSDMSGRSVPGSTDGNEKTAHTLEVTHRFVRGFRYEDAPWREAQEAGLLWSPLRKPHENADDPHWMSRGTYADIHHPAQGRSFRYPVSKWLSTATAWQHGDPPPRLGEHNALYVDKLVSSPAKAATPTPATIPAQPRLSPHGKPFALQGIRIFDFSWFLASAGGTRFLAGLGAEVLKVEWKENPDTRFAAMAPVGGRAARQAATAPLPGVKDPDMGGQFNNKNSGKLGLSLNIRDPRGLAIAKDLIRQSDAVAEGFSPGVLDRLGLGYDVLRSLKPDIIYIQQSGMGSHGSYGRMRTVGPVAAALTGTSEMSGLPEPAMPAGWGYSYLDWIGAYSFALAIMGAIHHRNRTGEGQWIDASQCESGLFLSGSTIVDWSATGREWKRIGNRSPYKKAAPHGAFRCTGTDNWIAIACFSDVEWAALALTAGRPEWLEDKRFATLDKRLAHQDELERLVSDWTREQDVYECMNVLQRAGVPAGVCQTAEGRCDRDPQLAALNWLTEVRGTKLGEWPVAELPFKLSATPSHAGGPINRGAPCYGEDNVSILGRLLGISEHEVKRLAEDGVI